jgi:PAS domain S-box-containing protein
MRFRSMVQRASDVFTVVDPDGTIVYQSPAVLRVFGYSPDELQKRSFLDLVHPADRAAVIGLLAEAAAAPEASASCELRLTPKGGSWRITEVVISNLLHDPHVQGLVLNSRDITAILLRGRCSRNSSCTRRSTIR